MPQCWNCIVDDYAKKHDLCEFDKAHIFVHTPNKHLQLPSSPAFPCSCDSCGRPCPEDDD